MTSHVSFRVLVPALQQYFMYRMNTEKCSFFMPILIAGSSTSQPCSPIQIQLIGHIQQDVTGFCNLILEKLKPCQPWLVSYLVNTIDLFVPFVIHCHSKTQILATPLAVSTCSTHILIHPPPTFNYQLCMPWATSPFFKKATDTI